MSGLGTKAVVGVGASLTYFMTDNNNALTITPNGLQTYQVNGGTLSFECGSAVFAGGYNASKLGAITVDGGSVNVTCGRFGVLILSWQPPSGRKIG